MLESKNYIAIPPGETIKEQLQDRGMTQKEFAERMELSQKHVSKLINGEVHLTQNVALKLSYVLGIPASFWNNLESIYREQLQNVEIEKKMESDKSIARKFPYADCARLGWLPTTRKIEEKIHNLREFFQVSHLTLIFESSTDNISFRRLVENANTDYSAIMWIQKARNVADKMNADKINISNLSKELNTIRDMTTKDPYDFYPQLTELLAKSGIKLVLLESLKGSFLHGATFLYRNSIVLGITDRGKDADKFWFSLFHEIAHIILGHIYEQETNETMELEADKYAQSILIPVDDYNEFISTGEFNRGTISRFSEKINISSGIVVGRLQNDGYIKFSQFNDLKNKYTIAR